MEPLLRVENLTKHFSRRKGFLAGSREKVRAVEEVSLEVRQGETLSLVGESGCGKSTTGRLMLRLIEPTRGRIWFKGREITTLSRRALRPLRPSLQIVFQDPHSSLNPRLTVREIIGEGLRLHRKMGPAEKKDRILEVMAKVGLRPEHYGRYPHEFSGGQRQRIGVARAIILDPELVVADEPLSALDVSIQAQVINLLERLKGDLGLSYLFISHDLSVVEYLSDRIAVMYLGRIVELAGRDRLYDRPAHPYTAALFSAAPVPRVGGKKQRIILQGDVPNPLRVPSGCGFHPRCGYCRPICRETRPELTEIEPGHRTACHFPLG